MVPEIVIAGIDPFTILVGVLVAAASVAVSLALTPDFNDSREGSETNIRSAEEPQDVVYGIATKGGVIVFINGTDDDNRYLHLILVVAGHPIEKFGAMHFNSETVELEASLNLPGPAASVALINSSAEALRSFSVRDRGTRFDSNALTIFNAGVFNQADQDFIEAQNSQWTENHTLTGLSWVYNRLEYDPELYTSFIPNVTAEVVGKKDIWDPRDGTERWTMNPALILADILETYLAVPRAKIDEASLIAAANVCDEAVAKKDASQELRYTANGTFKLDGNWEDYLMPVINSMAGALIEFGGTYYIHAGTWTDPVITITDDDLMGPIGRRVNESEQKRANSAKGKFTSPQNFDKPTEFPPIKDAVAIGNDGGVVNWLELDLKMVNGHTQAQRLASIFLKETRLDETITLDLPLYLGLDIKPWDNVRYISEIFGIDQTYRVVEHAIIPRGGRSPMVVVEVVLKRHEASVYNWNPATQEKDISTAKTNVPGVGATSPTAVTYSVTPIALDDDHKAATVQVDWTDPVDPFLEVEIEIDLDVECRQQDTDPGTPGNQPGSWIPVTISETRTIASGVETATIDIEDETQTSGPYEFQNHTITKARIRAKLDAVSYGPWIAAEVS